MTSVRALRRNLIIATSVCLACALGLTVWLVSPGAPSERAATQQLLLAQRQLTALQLEDSQLSSLQQRIHTSSQQVRELMAAGMPLETGASSKILQEISRFSGRSGIQVSEVQFKPDEKANQNLRRVLLTLQVVGSYADIVRFINQVEQSPMFFIIDQVSVSANKTAFEAQSTPGVSTAPGNAVRLQLELEAYEQATTVSAAPPPSARAGGRQ